MWYTHYWDKYIFTTSTNVIFINYTTKYKRTFYHVPQIFPVKFMFNLWSRLWWGFIDSEGNKNQYHIISLLKPREKPLQIDRLRIQGTVYVRALLFHRLCIDNYIDGPFVIRIYYKYGCFVFAHQVAHASPRQRRAPSGSKRYFR